MYGANIMVHLEAPLLILKYFQWISDLYVENSYYAISTLTSMRNSCQRLRLTQLINLRISESGFVLFLLFINYLKLSFYIGNF